MPDPVKPPNIVCSLTGLVPNDPVITPAGFIYDRRMIEQYLDQTGNMCPQTKEPLKREDLRTVKIPPHQLKFTIEYPNNVTNLLQVLSNDFDATMLEQYKTKEENIELKKELSTSLYTSD